VGKKNDRATTAFMAAGLVAGDEGVGVKLAQPPATHDRAERHGAGGLVNGGNDTRVFTSV
jgi:hypothetical protein